MDVLLKGRRYRITDEDRAAAGKKLAHLSRMEPRSVRVEVEVIEEKNPRLSGTKRVEASLDLPRKTFRAHAEDKDLGTALDRVVEKLERQVRDHAGKRRHRTPRGANRLESAGIAPEQPAG